MVSANLASFFGLYVPIELTVVATYMVYTTVGVTWTGQTVGDWIYGLDVACRNGRRPSPVRAFARAVFVAVFQCLACLPFLVIAGRRAKGGWHDRLSGTQVRLLPNRRTRRRRATVLVWSLVAAWLAVHTVDACRLYRTHRAWCADADARAEQRYERTDSAVEVSSLDDAQRRDMTTWLAEHAQDPGRHVIDTAAQHQVTIIGEIHGKKQYPAFFNRIIPDLCHEAGVRTLAVEWCHPDLDDELRLLVTAKEFDRELAMEIARRAIWEAWGRKGYWDVLETVWRLNRLLGADQEALRVVGISRRVDLPSFALVKQGPLQEKLRMARLLRPAALARLVYHDAVYARAVCQRRS
jgi:uncharacterized RDD family membrane protein YckC